MYKSYFGLKENPFNVNPDPRYLYLTKQIEEALTGLMYGIQTRKGFITLTGEVGTGKTTLVNRLLDWLRQRRTRTAFLFNSRMNTSHLFDFILAEFEIVCESRTKSQQLMKLNQWLLERYRAGETAVLIIDEAQNLSYPVLEEIRMLTNLEPPRKNSYKLCFPASRNLKINLKLAAIATAKTTHHPTMQDGASYQGTNPCIYRRTVANRGHDRADIFSPEAMDTVHMYSLGIPRVVNLLCEHALINTYVEQERIVSPKVVEDIAREFQLDEIEPIPPARHRRESTTMCITRSPLCKT